MPSPRGSTPPGFERWPEAPRHLRRRGTRASRPERSTNCSSILAPTQTISLSWRGARCAESWYRRRSMILQRQRSSSAGPIGERSPSWPIPPRIVAEALAAVTEPPLPVRASELVPARSAARAMAIAVMPAQSDAAPPAWLLPGQETAFRRALAALEMFAGALVPERTGAGKTYIALAVAAAWSAKPAVCVVPAAVADQWRRTARRLSTEIIVGTHERASRGILPRHAGLVIVDESHRFRNPEARRHSVVARWLVGRPALLLTATPAVNRLADLVAQLRLVVPDDVLTRWGVNSLRSLAAARSMPDAVAHLIVRSASGVPQPDRRYRTERMSAEPECIELIDRLVLSSSAPVARLVRGVLLRAAASSSAALAGVLRRYRLLLLHASDAAGSGVRIGRAALRRCIGAAADQTALWPLLAPGTDDVELALSDIDAIEQIERRARDLLRRPDAHAERLGQMLADGRRTLVFTGWRETAEWLRGTLGPARVAWCTGSDAGIGRMRLARSEVLGMFGPHPQRAAPQVLITTDVASEGLDLQGAERVVHYDLPWTPMRLTQRDGRAARLGNLLPAVEIVRFDPPEELDRRLRQTEILRRKGRLPTEAGVKIGRAHV